MFFNLLSIFALVFTFINFLGLRLIASKVMELQILINEKEVNLK